jgi:hypothetical protein
MSLPPGFAAYLERQFKECDVVHTVAYTDEKKEEVTEVKLKAISLDVTTQHMMGVDWAQGHEVTVIEVRGSTNIAREEYVKDLKELKTTFKSGGFCIYAGVTPEELEFIIHPGKEFDYSVGKAHYALIVKKKEMISKSERS